MNITETPTEQTMALNVTSEKQPFNGLDSPFLASEIVLGLVPNCISYLYIKNDLKVHQHIRRLLLFGSVGNCVGLGKKIRKYPNTGCPISRVRLRNNFFRP